MLYVLYYQSFLAQTSKMSKPKVSTANKKSTAKPCNSKQNVTNAKLAETQTDPTNLQKLYYCVTYADGTVKNRKLITEKNEDKNFMQEKIQEDIKAKLPKGDYTIRITGISEG